MIDLLLINGRVMTPEGLLPDALVGIEGSRIAWVGAKAEAPTARRTLDLDGALLLPGFIDIQVNGGGDVLFNDDPTPEGVRKIAAAHRAFGVTGLLPTLISDHRAVVREGVAAVNQALAQNAPGLLGVHLEGPFINKARRGIHDASRVAVLSLEDIPLLSGVQGGKTVVTLAPELAPAGFIESLVARGVRVCAGHTDADYEDLSAAFTRGVTGVTHLFNAMSPLTSRAPGAVGAALENQDAWCGLIVDGRHVSPVVLKLALKLRPIDRFMLVSDAMPCVGGRDTFRLNGRLIRASGPACFDESGVLAGSNLGMSSAVRNAMDMLGLDLKTASEMASAHPADFLGLGGVLGRIRPGYFADLVIADDALKVRGVVIRGEPQASGSGNP